MTVNTLIAYIITYLVKALQYAIRFLISFQLLVFWVYQKVTFWIWYIWGLVLKYVGPFVFSSFDSCGYYAGELMWFVVLMFQFICFLVYCFFPFICFIFLLFWLNRVFKWFSFLFPSLRSRWADSPFFADFLAEAVAESFFVFVADVFFIVVCITGDFGWLISDSLYWRNWFKEALAKIHLRKKAKRRLFRRIIRLERLMYVRFSRQGFGQDPIVSDFVVSGGLPRPRRFLNDWFVLYEDYCFFRRRIFFHGLLKDLFRRCPLFIKQVFFCFYWFSYLFLIFSGMLFAWYLFHFALILFICSLRFFCFLFCSLPTAILNYLSFYFSCNRTLKGIIFYYKEYFFLPRYLWGVFASTLIFNFVFTFFILLYVYFAWLFRWFFRWSFLFIRRLTQTFFVFRFIARLLFYVFMFFYSPVFKLVEFFRIAYFKDTDTALEFFFVMSDSHIEYYFFACAELFFSYYDDIADKVSFVWAEFWFFLDFLLSIVFLFFAVRLEFLRDIFDMLSRQWSAYWIAFDKKWQHHPKYKEHYKFFWLYLADYRNFFFSIYIFFRRLAFRFYYRMLAWAQNSPHFFNPFFWVKVFYRFLKRFVKKLFRFFFKFVYFFFFQFCLRFFYKLRCFFFRLVRRLWRFFWFLFRRLFRFFVLCFYFLVFSVKSFLFSFNYRNFSRFFFVYGGFFFSFLSVIFYKFFFCFDFIRKFCFFFFKFPYEAYSISVLFSLLSKFFLLLIFCFVDFVLFLFIYIFFFFKFFLERFFFSLCFILFFNLRFFDVFFWLELFYLLSLRSLFLSLARRYPLYIKFLRYLYLRFRWFFLMVFYLACRFYFFVFRLVILFFCFSFSLCFSFFRFFFFADFFYIFVLFRIFFVCFYLFFVFLYTFFYRCLLFFRFFIFFFFLYFYSHLRLHYFFDFFLFKRFFLLSIIKVFYYTLYFFIKDLFGFDSKMRVFYLEFNFIHSRLVVSFWMACGVFFLYLEDFFFFLVILFKRFFFYLFFILFFDFNFSLRSLYYFRFVLFERFVFYKTIFILLSPLVSL